MEGRIANKIGRIGGTAVLAGAAVFGADLAGAGRKDPSVDAAAAACVGRTTSFEMAPGQTRTFKAKDAIITGDVWVKEGNEPFKRNFDDLAETGAVTVFQSDNCANITVKADYGASVQRIADKETDRQVLVRQAKATNKMASTGGNRAADVYLHR